MNPIHLFTLGNLLLENDLQALLDLRVPETSLRPMLAEVMNTSGDRLIFLFAAHRLLAACFRAATARERNRMLISCGTARCAHINMKCGHAKNEVVDQGILCFLLRVGDVRALGTIERRVQIPGDHCAG